MYGAQQGCALDTPHFAFFIMRWQTDKPVVDNSWPLYRGGRAPWMR